jgi:8-oxo-dGTP pyrophosphatase MutT (NUDIX family)
MAEYVSQQELHRIVMTAIIYRETEDGYRYLVTKRSPHKKVFPNLWTVPGGGLEPSDYEGKEKTTEDAWYFVLEEALKREVKEEVGLEIGKPKYLLDLVFIRPDNVPVLTLSYYAPYESGEVVLEEGDSTEYRWIMVSEVPALDFISGIGSEIVMADEILHGEDNPQLRI